NEKITVDDVRRVLEQFKSLQPEENGNQVEAIAKGLLVNLDQPLREARDDFERLYFEYQIQKADKNMSRVAEAAELERTHLYRKLKQLGIKTK
ncbi:MAG: sigma-54-dependent Fis family transcriptional regulator, partial [Methylophilaceae bacterium]|nr:sigma-54-dependent Fis family transcriptional regulator [Methylophilaceae bacterium]